MKVLVRIFNVIVIFLAANCYSIMNWNQELSLLWIVLILFIGINFLPSFFNRKLKTWRLKNCDDGCELLELFLISVFLCAIYLLIGWIGALPFAGSIVEEPGLWLISLLVVYLVENLVFWNGMIRIFCTSVQLRIKWRIIAALCGMIPIVNLIVLGKMLCLVRAEIAFENDKIILNEARKEDKICETKYPILLVHGVFFRDSRYFNYWGRVPKELEGNGATLFYGNHESAASVEECGKELDERIRQIVNETGCGKVNVIAHSKGGLDTRYAISNLGTGEFVASLTTINTPHRGCEFAEYLLTKVSEKQLNAVARAYNASLKKLGDKQPDFVTAVSDLRADVCLERNKRDIDDPNVYYQSVGSTMKKALGGRFPLNCTHHLVKYFDGKNDGLVGEKSFPWGDNFRQIEAKGKRGISHGDMIDLNRENFDGFDVREFYVDLVHDLKNKGF